MPLEIAQAFLGKYSILKLIGQGGFGRVYLAEEQPPSRRRVAIKELRHDLPEAVEQEARERFEREIEVGSQLEHPHVVKMLTYERQDDGIYLVLEYMAGGSLYQRLRQEGALPVAEAVRIAIEVCQALEYLHQHPLDLVHRDVTPNNILFAADGTAKLMDFGVVQSPGYTWSRWSGGRQEHPGHPFYRAPAARDSDPLRPTADVYMLGCVLWEMLTGHVYFHYPPGTPPSRLRPEVPSELDALVLKAVTENWRERYQAAKDLREALAGFQTAQQAVEWARREAEAQAKREAAAWARQQRLAGWFSDARRLVSDDPERALAQLAQIRSEEPEYPGVAELETQGQKMLAQHQKRAEKARRQQEPERLTQAATEHLREKRWGEALRSADELEGLGRWGRQRAKGVRSRVRRGQPAQVKEQEGQWGRGKGRIWLVAGLAALALIAVLVVTRPEWWFRFFPTPEPRTRSKDGMVMVYVPAGEFPMGSADSDSQATAEEKPQHTVSLDAFWIDQTEVTNAQYRAFVAATGRRVPTTCDWGEPTYDDAAKAEHPVVCVSWYDAMAYCQWAGARLPTEAEWEKAARGADGRTYPWGDTFDGLRLNFCDCNCELRHKDVNADDDYGRTAPVGSYPVGASPYGALDMAGNVWEWVADWYDSGYYARSPAEGPPGPDRGGAKVLRGGSWNTDSYGARSAYRYWITPDVRYIGVGFRCCVAAQQP